MGVSQVQAQHMTTLKEDEVRAVQPSGSSSQKIGGKAIKILKTIVPKEVGEFRRSPFNALSPLRSDKQISNQGADNIKMIFATL